MALLGPSRRVQTEPGSSQAGAQEQTATPGDGGQRIEHGMEAVR